MTINIEWQVTNLDVFAESLGSDNVVCNIHLLITATDGIARTERTIVVGVSPNEESTFIPYDDLTHAIVLSWAKDKLGSGVEKIEDELQQSLQPINNSAPLPNLPWVVADK